MSWLAVPHVTRPLEEPNLLWICLCLRLLFIVYCLFIVCLLFTVVPVFTEVPGAHTGPARCLDCAEGRTLPARPSAAPDRAGLQRDRWADGRLW